MQNTNEDAKVVSIFSAKSQSKAESSESVSVTEENSSENGKEESFFDVMKRNEEIQDRMRKERLKANQAVLKSYRIKN